MAVMDFDDCYRNPLWREDQVRVLCISASNILHSKENSTSRSLCAKIAGMLREKEIACEIVVLRDYPLHPCIGCGKCFESKRCCMDSAFNMIYEKMVEADALFFVSLHYAPIPAKLSMILEKMEEITFLHWWKDSTYKSEVYGVPAGIISHGGGSDWALKSYKAMVNDTIANALDTIQCKTIPYDPEWDTGISLPVQEVLEEDSVFPIQKYDWNLLDQTLRDYVELVLKEV